MAAPAPPVAVQPLPALADETLEEIFLLLPTPAALVRASAACTTFRRIVTERSFLRQFRKRQPPPLLGLVDDKGDFHPTEEPHPSAPLAKALVAAADFTYSFVPKPPARGTSWYARDVRDGRVLLESSISSSRSDSRSGRTIRTTRYAVCDPLSRRYALLPPIPEDMAVQQHDLLVEFEPNLAPAGEDEDDETCFKVICTARYQTKLVAFVFASVAGQWRVGASSSWASLGVVASLKWASAAHLYSFNYSSGCFYWPSPCRRKLLVLNTHRMEFSVVSYSIRLDDRLLDTNTSTPVVVAGTEGALEIIALVCRLGRLGTTPAKFYISYAAQQNNGESSIEWQLKNVKTLPHGYFYFHGGATDGMLFLQRKTWDVESQSVGRNLTAQEFFSLEVNTLELKKVCRGKPCRMPSGCVHAYFGFPPSLSKPSL
ncbi:hypothetical protein ACQ4PT_065042 [Festuca glaucescens]